MQPNSCHRDSNLSGLGVDPHTLKLAQEILHQLEIANDSRDLSGRETWFRNNLKKHSLALASLKRTIARLRSRIGWLREGDANTKLFHLHSCHRGKIS
jgi:hypothetical protein